MIDAEDIAVRLSRSVVVRGTDDGVRVTTHCLYPSNTSVSVVVTGALGGSVVSDQGAATDEVGAWAPREALTDRQIRALIKHQGLKVHRGVIYSPPMGIEEIPAAILLVANASKEVADWALGRLRFDVKRNFRSELAGLLEKQFNDNLKSDPIVVGASNRTYKFAHVVYLSGERRLLVDPAQNDPSSINARVVANMDVRMAKDPLTQQIIVYDDSQKWGAAELRLLELGARTVPFSRAAAEIQTLAA